MKSGLTSWVCKVAVCLTLITAACTQAPVRIIDEPPYAFNASPVENSIFSQYAPIFIPQRYEKRYNRIGEAKARYTSDDTGEEIYIDPTTPVFYVQQQPFETEAGERYLNLIYRIHFEEVPYSLSPFHLTAGKNGGLFIITTINENNQPVLITTVHTCGCYLAILPTSYLPPQAYPEHWSDEQEVFGERLPGVLRFPAVFDFRYRPGVFLRDGTHRVMNVEVIDASTLASSYRVVAAELRPMEALKQLPLPDNNATSFYHNTGRHQGYVKNAVKPLELLLMSWWTFDLHIGSDKELGNKNETGSVFYTSLKPWNRNASDMWNFPHFLSFWGWKL